MNCSKDSVRLITFNILFDYGEGNSHSWKLRRDAVFALLRFHAPDVCCFQEPLQGQVDDLANAFPDYCFQSAGCRDGKHDGQHMSVFYASQKFEKLDGGIFSLSETPDKIGSVGWDAKNPRLALWVKLLCKRTGKSFYTVCTHLDHIGETARRESALLLCDKMNTLADGVPVFICGDFNANPNSQTYENMLLRGFKDCFSESGIVSYGEPFTYHKFLLEENSYETAAENYRQDTRVLQVIDHIFCSGNNGDVRILRHGVLNDSRKGKYPSDHFPKICDFLLT